MTTRQAPEIYELIVRETNYPYLGETIHLFIGGSAAHGAKLDNKSDFDLLGVYIPPLEEIVGIRDVEPHYVWSTAGDKVRNSPQDIDMNMYSLRKWAKMVTSGNPTAIEFLFMENLAPKGIVWETFITPNLPVFLSSHAGFHFQKFCEHMLRTMKGEGTGKRGKRPDLITEFGYDTKAAMHLIRVLNEGIELMQTGRITLPRPEKEFLIDIRRGTVSTLRDVEAMARELFAKLEAARLASYLPPTVDMNRVSRIITSAQESVWNHSNEVLQVLTKAFAATTWWISEFSKSHPTSTGQWEDQKMVEKDFVALAVELHDKDKTDKASEAISDVHSSFE
jgi:predicted nucleotidyltransferase